MEVLTEFLRSVELDWSTGCWRWVGPSKSKFGHGQFRLRLGGTRSTHRIAWMLHNGPIPEGLFVLHRCDVPSCVNPEHLFLGTQQDNIDDMWSKGRGRLPAKKSHCVRGHEFTPENTFRKENGCKACKRCRSDNQLAYRSRNLEAVRKYQRERMRRLRAEGARLG